MAEPLKVFVASSSEHLAVAREVAASLAGTAGLEVRAWDEDVFEFSRSYIESLERQLDSADFAVVVLTADDAALVRDRLVNLPRDNVVFELGLFIGRLGRERCFFFVDHGDGTRIASDLEGVKPVTFHRDPADLARGLPDLATQAQRVARQMLALDSRYKPDPRVREEQEALWRFACRIQGHWWERIRKGEDAKSALSYVDVRPDPVNHGIALHGDVFDRRGRPLADWDSVLTGIVLGPRPVIHYRWQGEHKASHGQTFGGGGEIQFEDDGGRGLVRGYFYDTNFAQLPQGAPTVAKNFRLHRCSAEDVLRMADPASQLARTLVQERLGLAGE